MKTYSVEKGNHYSVGFFQKLASLFSAFGKKEVQFSFMFYSNCFDASPVTQVNKVGGITWGLNDDHKNSSRLGFDTKGQLYAYYYSEGAGPLYVPLLKAQSSEWYDVRCNDTGVSVTGPMGVHAEYNFPKPLKTSFFAFLCFFYWGGNDTAPREVSIEQEWK